MIHNAKQNIRKSLFGFPTISDGFTLIELLVTMFIMTTVGTLIIGIFVVSLRSTTKVNNLQLIRQNGNYTVQQMVKMLQFAQRFDGVSTNGTTFVTSCETPPSSTAQLTQYRYVRFTAYDGGQTTFSCQTGPDTIASNSASLIDTNTYSITACSFTCTQFRADSPQAIGVSFTLQKNSGVNILEDPAPLDFQTSVTMRNLAE